MTWWIPVGLYVEYVPSSCYTVKVCPIVLITLLNITADHRTDHNAHNAADNDAEHNTRY